jgi:hypothetical protein
MRVGNDALFAVNCHQLTAETLPPLDGSSHTISIATDSAENEMNL